MGSSTISYSQRWRAIRPHMIYGIPVVLLSLATLSTAASFTMYPDSEGYITFSPQRNAGYPLFLALLQYLGAGWETVVTIQIIIGSAALAILGYAVMGLSRSPWPAALAVIAIGANPWFLQYHFAILSESLFTSLEMAIIAMILLLIKRKTPMRWAILSLLIGGAIALRPIGWAFVPLLAILALLPWRDVRSSARITLAAAVLPLGIVLGAEAAVYRAYHGEERTSLAPKHFFAKAPLVESDGINPYPDDHPYAPLWNRIEDDAAPVRRLIADISHFGLHPYILFSYEFFFQFHWLRDELAQAAEDTGKSIDDVQWEIAIERISSDIPGYLRLTGSHFLGSWIPVAHFLPGTLEAFRASLDGTDFPLTDPTVYLGPLETHPLAIPTSLILAAIGVISLLVIGQGLARLLRGRRLDPRQQGPFLLALMIHGYFLLNALTATWAVRYTITLWPAMAVLLILAGRNLLLPLSPSPRGSIPRRARAR